MKQNYTHMVMLLDSSSSMAGCWSETVQSLTKMFNEQKDIEGEMTFSLYTFNENVSSPYNFVDIQTIKELSLTHEGGWTALYKAFCKAVDETGVKLANLTEDKRPSKVLFVVFTDGEENRSGVGYNLLQVKNKLREQKDKYSWQFLFMGADFDAEKLGGQFGLSVDNCINYSKGATSNSVMNTSGLIGKYRTSNSSSLDTNDLRGLKASIGK